MYEIADWHLIATNLPLGSVEFNTTLGTAIPPVLDQLSTLRAHFLTIQQTRGIALLLYHAAAVECSMLVLLPFIRDEITTVGKKL